MASLKLYHASLSPPSRCALLAIRALNLDATIEPVNLFAGDHLKPEFVAINPQHVVPTLSDGDFVIWESRAIACYLASKYDKSKKLYPTDDLKIRAKVDQLLYFDSGTMFPSMRNIAFPVIRMGETKIPKEKKDKVNDALGFFNTFLEGKTWAAGTADYTVADLSLLATISGFVYVGWDISPFPNVQKWMKSCEAIPGYAENKEGATAFGNFLISKVDPGEF